MFVLRVMTFGTSQKCPLCCKSLAQTTPWWINGSDQDCIYSSLEMKIPTTCTMQSKWYYWRKCMLTKNQVQTVFEEGICFKSAAIMQTLVRRESLYIESRLLDIETITDKNRIMMGERLKRMEANPWMKLQKNTTPGGWNELLKMTKEKYDTTEEDLGKSEYTTMNTSIRKLRPPSKK